MKDIHIKMDMFNPYSTLMRLRLKYFVARFGEELRTKRYTIEEFTNSFLSVYVLEDNKCDSYAHYKAVQSYYRAELLFFYKMFRNEGFIPNWQELKKEMEAYKN